MWREVPDVITTIKFNVDRFGVFDPWESKNRSVPLTRRVALTTVLHYRADCDY